MLRGPRPVRWWPCRSAGGGSVPDAPPRRCCSTRSASGSGTIGTPATSSPNEESGWRSPRAESRSTSSTAVTPTASVHQPDEPLDPQWQEKIDEAPAAWLLTHLERFASGVDVRRAVLDDYALRQGGGSPPTIEWAIRL